MKLLKKGEVVLKIDWDEYKEYKQFSVRNDNFETLLDFVKSYYHMVLPQDIYDMLKADDTAALMLNKRSINDAVDLENFLYKL